MQGAFSVKYVYRLVLFALLASLITACGAKSDDPNAAVAVIVALTQTASAPSAPTVPAATAVVTGIISGNVGLMAPPTPHMIVYAVDQATGKWASVETPPNDNGAGTFSLTLPPGTYQLFAFTDDNGYSVYSTDGESLSSVKVDANQTVSNIMVQFPGQGDCGISMGVPASPDGKFKAVPGPSADCIAQVTTSQAASAVSSGDQEPIRIQFLAGSSSWSTPVDVQPNGTSAYTLNAMKGQTMTVTLNCTLPSSGSFYIRTAGGIILQPRAFSNWSFVLPDSQDYVVGVDNPTQQAIRCTLGVSIPPAGSAPADSAPSTATIAKDQPIRFATGPMEVELEGTVISGQRDRYTLDLLKGEMLDVILNSSNAAFTIIGPDGNPLMGTEEGKDRNNWAVPAPSDGSYAILVGPTRGNATYTLKVAVSE